MKIIAILIAIGIPGIASLWESPGYLLLCALNRELISTPIRFGVLVSIILGMLWVLFAAGRAYELAGVPELIVSDDLKLDGLNFRLRLEAKQKDFETTVRLMEILDHNDQSIPGPFPLEMEWTGHPGQSLVRLKAGIPESVSLINMRREGIAKYILQYTGATFLGPLDFEIGEKVYFHLRIEHRKNKPLERWFSFERKALNSFESLPATPPSITQQQVIPSDSKRVR